ncbi:hypothetical protein OEZ60_20480 [Defluviimonas sp. WL0024]|uniref:Holin of 3TMs, for gene-transfer release n=1 Tax=Albidovulum salinarum TaxID=2984153 RepID=A0ABT2X8T5_9RHOB|nr:hypothetical protein [Defluviimonas sp. WL0024]MCU9850365.1 hypothetical protein [Defluviimonas sp. WL0024]
MAPALTAIAAEIGAPLVKSILSKKIGAANAELAGQVIGMIAHKAGVHPSDVDRLAAEQPEKVREAVLAVEADAPELLDLWSAELVARQALFVAEASEPLWVRAWRPLGMYGLGFLWLWNLVLLHVANAYWKIALPPTDLAVLMQISALYMSLYMGGHTLKDMVSKWKGRV